MISGDGWVMGPEAEAEPQPWRGAGRASAPSIQKAKPHFDYCQPGALVSLSAGVSFSLGPCPLRCLLDCRKPSESPEEGRGCSLEEGNSYGAC